MSSLIPVPQKSEFNGNAFVFSRDGSGAVKYDYVKDETIPVEGYEIKAADGHLVLKSSDEAGRFYGEVTLGALDALTGGAPGEFYISDAPAFGYRGYMLDVSRYFFDVETVLKHIDYMALLKLNTLHLHLTDDQGWRVEIKKYPRLTSVGAYRRRTLMRFREHGGYYTQEDLKKIVAYAHSRHISVVPEIDFPGHFSAAIAAYPELGCYGEHVKVAETFGIKYDVACIGKESTVAFMKDVLEELFTVFTDEYYHLGGDEVMCDRWNICPECRKQKEKLGCESWSEVQAYVLKELVSFLAEHGKKAVIWNESAPSPGSDKSVIWQYWQGGLDENKLTKEVNAGRRVIMSPSVPYYLDLPYSVNSAFAIINYKPVGDNITEKGNVLGVEFPLWTELVPTAKQADKKLFPRLIVGAEAAWRGAPEKDAVSRAEKYYPLLKRLGAKPGKPLCVKRGLSFIADKLWWERRRLYWGVLGNLVGDLKARHAAKRRLRQPYSHIM